MDFINFVQTSFYGLISFVAIYITTILSGLKNSVDELNIRVAVIIEKTSNHEKRIEKLEGRDE